MIKARLRNARSQSADFAIKHMPNMRQPIMHAFVGIAIILTSGMLCCLYPQYAQAVTPVRLQLHWTHQFEFAGYYAALEQGYYTEEGLDVSILEGGPGVVPLKLLEQGKTDIIVGNSEILLARLNQKPIVALAAIFQHSAAALLTLADSTIHAPQDLIGKTIEMGRRISDAEMYAMLSNEGLADDQYKHVDSTFSLKNLTTGKVDAVSAYISNQPFHLKERGIPYRLIRPVWFGIDFYGDMLATSEAYLYANTETAERFLRASMKGWEYAFSHPDEIIHLILTKYATSKFSPSKAKLYYEYAQMRKLVMPDIIEIGHMNEGRFRHMADTFVGLGLAKGGYSLDGFVWTPERSGVDWNNWAVRTIFGCMLAAILFALTLVLHISRLKRDIQQRASTNDALQKNVKQLSLALKGSQLGLWHWNHNEKSLSLDSQCAELLGRGTKELHIRDEKQGNEASAAFYSTVSQHLQEGFESIDADFATEQTQAARWLQCKGSVVEVDSQGTPVQAAGTLSDNTMPKNYLDELEELCITDSLTGVHNRRHLIQQLELNLTESTSGGATVSIAFLDIDEFQQLSHAYGHQTSDAILKEIAWILKSPLRPYDIFTRFGGDEFVVMFHDADKHQAKAMLDEMRVLLYTHSFSAQGTQFNMTFSAGLADSTELSPALLQPEQLIAEADRRMLVAKKNGKNMIIVE